MPIWFGELPIDYANAKAKDCLIGNLGIELVEAGEDFLKARMPVDSRTCNPAGVLHGGASVALAETLGTWAASFCVDPAKHHCVGLEINANHVRPAAAGSSVYGVARPLHLGRSTHVWEIRVTDEGGKLVCVSRFTVAVLNTPGKY